MKNWRTETKLYMVVENTKKSHVEYYMNVTGEEISNWCKNKNEMYGYIQGAGGDKSYTCWACEVRA